MPPRRFESKRIVVSARSQARRFAKVNRSRSLLRIRDKALSLSLRLMAGISIRFETRRKDVRAARAFLLLHHDVLVDDVVGHHEGLQVQKVNVPALCAQEKVLTTRFQTHRGDLLQLPFQRQRLRLDHRALVDFPQVKGVVVAEGHQAALSDSINVRYCLYLWSMLAEYSTHVTGT